MTLEDITVNMQDCVAWGWSSDEDGGFTDAFDVRYVEPGKVTFQLGLHDQVRQQVTLTITVEDLL